MSIQQMRFTIMNTENNQNPNQNSLDKLREFVAKSSANKPQIPAHNAMNALEALAAMRKSQYQYQKQVPVSIDRINQIRQKIYKLSAEIHELNGSINVKNEEIRWLLGELTRIAPVERDNE